MPDGFERLSSISLPLLERVAREERLGGNQPRRRREEHPDRRQEDRFDRVATEEQGEEAETSMSSTRVDLRI